MKYLEEITVIKKRMIVSEGKAESPAEVAEIIREHIQGDEREHFIVLLLNNKNKIAKIHTVSIGTVSESIVHPREVFRAAIVFGASSIIVAHNHPSGALELSKEDIATTERLKEAAKIIGIQLLDHVIIGDGFYSMRENGYF